MIDLDDNRLEVAEPFGATACIDNGDGKAGRAVMSSPADGRRSAIEAVGMPATFDLLPRHRRARRRHRECRRARREGRSAPRALWDRNIAITTRLVDTVTTPMLLKTVIARIDPQQLITHRFKFDKILDAYDTFAAAAKTHALKVLIEA